jgi:hypothetical protein
MMHRERTTHVYTSLRQRSEVTFRLVDLAKGLVVGGIVELEGASQGTQAGYVRAAALVSVELIHHQRVDIVGERVGRCCLASSW